MTTPWIHFTSPSKFVIDGPGVLDWRKANRVFEEGAEFSPRFKNKQWDGFRYPGRNNGKGQLELGRGYLIKILEDLSATIVRPPDLTPRIPFENIEGLRDYQNESLRLIFEKRWGRIALPTNAGKGAIIALSAKIAAERGHRVLIACDELAVYYALKEEFEKWAGYAPDTVTSDKKKIPTGAVVLAMIPTLYARTSASRKKAPEGLRAWRDWLGTFSFALFDEADKSTSTSWQKSLEWMKNTHYRIGFSGTFFPDQKSVAEIILTDSMGPVLLRLRNEQMIERKISAKPLVELIPFHQEEVTLPPSVIWRKMSSMEKRQWYFELGVIRNEIRHQLIASLLTPDGPNAIIVNYLEHGRLLAATLPDALFLSGDDEPEIRQSTLERFKRGEFQNLVVSKILDRGTNDLGHAVGLVFASGQGSHRQTLQRIGRGLRRSGGKEFLFLRDILDSGHKYFDNPSQNRLKIYNEEGFDIRISS